MPLLFLPSPSIAAYQWSAYIECQPQHRTSCAFIAPQSWSSQSGTRDPTRAYRRASSPPGPLSMQLSAPSPIWLSYNGRLSVRTPPS